MNPVILFPPLPFGFDGSRTSCTVVSFGDATKSRGADWPAGESSVCLALCADAAAEQPRSLPPHSAAPCAVDMRPTDIGAFRRGAKDMVRVYSIRRYGKHISVQVTAYLTS